MECAHLTSSLVFVNLLDKRERGERKRERKSSKAAVAQIKSNRDIYRAVERERGGGGGAVCARAFVHVCVCVCFSIPEKGCMRVCMYEDVSNAWYKRLQSLYNSYSVVHAPADSQLHVYSVSGIPEDQWKYSYSVVWIRARWGTFCCCLLPPCIISSHTLPQWPIGWGPDSRVGDIGMDSSVPGQNHLIDLVVRRPPQERKIPGSNPACAGIYSRSSHTSDLKISTPVATLPGTWRYRVSIGTGRPDVSILWLGEIESLVCNFYLSVAARKIVCADPSLRYTRMLLGR